MFVFVCVCVCVCVRGGSVYMCEWISGILSHLTALVVAIVIMQSMFMPVA